MAAFLLHEGATVVCLHSGHAEPVATFERVKVSGQPVVVQSDTYSISGCTLPTNAGGPCATAQFIEGAMRVTAGGQPVVLRDDQATCVPTGTGLQVVTTQTRVKGT